MKKTKKYISKLFTAFLLGLSLLISPSNTRAAYLFQSDAFMQVLASGILIDFDDNGPATDLIIQFGGLIAETIKWDVANSRFTISDDLRAEGNLGVVGQIFAADDHTAASSTGTLNLGRISSAWESLIWNTSTSRFDLSDDLNLNGGLEATANIDLNSNQLQEARLENLSSAPTCNSGATGRIYSNTTSNTSYVCNGTVFQNLSSKHYQNGAEVSDVITATWTGVTTTGGTTSIFLTDDGTSGGTKLFTEVYNVNAIATSILANNTAPVFAGYAYNSGTGQLQIKFLESSNILGLGIESLESETAGTTFSVFVIGK